MDGSSRTQLDKCENQHLTAHKELANSMELVSKRTEKYVVRRLENIVFVYST